MEEDKAAHVTALEIAQKEKEGVVEELRLKYVTTDNWSHFDVEDIFFLLD